MRTWHAEAAVIAVVLTCVAWVGGRPVDWLCALAVLLTFMHVQISFRLEEAERRRSKSYLMNAASVEAFGEQVECHRRLVVYYYAKETCWVVVFSIQGSWPALVGVATFLVYPLWRRVRGGRDGPVSSPAKDP